MKKTLVAVAILAASGASFAQVTMSGGMAYGYQATDVDGVQANGFGVDTASFKLSVTEDLGGGMMLSGSMVAAGLARGDNIAGEDFAINLSGGFGKLTLGQIEIGSGIRGLAQAGAPVNNMEGEVLGAAANSDIVKYTAPAFGGFTLSASHTEATGMGVGLAGVTSSRAGTVGVDYAAGALAAKLDFSQWASNATLDRRYRVAASYDLGVAKIGAGYDDVTLLNNAGNVRQTMVGVSAPLGAVSVGAAWVRNDTTGAAKVRDGFTIGANYALSKRTSLYTHFSSYDNLATSTVKSTKTVMVLDHQF